MKRKKSVTLAREDKTCIVCGTPTRTSVILDAENDKVDKVVFHICQDCLYNMLNKIKHSKT